MLLFLAFIFHFPVSSRGLGVCSHREVTRKSVHDFVFVGKVEVTKKKRIKYYMESAQWIMKKIGAHKILSLWSWIWDGETAQNLLT